MTEISQPTTVTHHLPTPDNYRSYLAATFPDGSVLHLIVDDTQTADGPGNASQAAEAANLVVVPIYQTEAGHRVS